MPYVAGHAFNDEGRCECRRRLVDILGCTKADIGQDGIAHSGQLTEFELSQIETERERIWRGHKNVAKESENVR